MGRIFTTQAILDGVSPLKDGGVTARFHTQEMSKADIAEFMSYYQSYGHLLFSENELKMTDIPTGNAYLDGGKSPSKRLKDRMFVYYKKKNQETSGFDKWYERSLEKIGNQYLDGIES